MMGFEMQNSLPIVLVFVQGLLSFFSPCVLPLLPLYIGYLSGGTGVKGPDGKIHYNQKRIMINTVFFVLGVSFAFVLLAAGVSVLKLFLLENRSILLMAGGALIILLALYQLGLFGHPEALEKERRLPFNISALALSPWTALAMGFFFSFAWTPCVGPMLSSVLIMAAASPVTAYLYLAVYTLGFILPFLMVAVFTGSLMELVKKHGNIVTHTAKAGGIIMLIIGGFMLWNGFSNGLVNTSQDVVAEKQVVSVSVKDGSDKDISAKDGSVKDISAKDVSDKGGSEKADVVSENSAEKTAAEAAVVSEKDVADKDSAEKDVVKSEKNCDKVEKGKTADEKVNAAVAGNVKDKSRDKGAAHSVVGNDEAKAAESINDSAQVVLPPENKELALAPDFVLKDQNGKTHRLSDYRGKTVFLNFWATWCPPCRRELPDIEKMYLTSPKTGPDALVVLGVAAPGVGYEKSAEEIKKFLEENNITYPVLMDENGSLFRQFGIKAFPTTFMITRYGRVYGQITGMLSDEMMHSIVKQTQQGKK